MNSIFTRQAIPEIVSGYPVDRWEFNVIVPEASTNLCTDPSFEIATTGINTAVSSTLARTTAQQKRGAYSMSITPSSGVVSGMFQSYTLTSGVAYTFSLDLLGVPGQEYDVFFTNSGGTLVSGVRTVRATGFWQRVSVMYQPTSTTGHRVYLRRKSYASTAVFYTDGWQLEQKSYPTTYLDGDMVGFVPGQSDFYWNGTPHNSTSTRNAKTRAGGREVKINDIATILAIIGLGMSPVANVALSNSMGWSSFQDSFAVTREFTVAMSLFGTPIEISRKRSELIDIFRPSITTPAQPMIMRVRPLGSDGLPNGETLDITCSYRGGLEGSIVSEGQERVGLQFVLYYPYIPREGSAGASFGFSSSVSSFTNIGYRDSNGEWKAMGTGCNGIVRAILVHPDGSVYVGGAFTLAGGVGSTGYFAKWNGSVWSALGSGLGLGGNTVLALAVGPDGAVYLAGSFTDAGGVLNADYLAKWNGTSYSALGSGINSTVWAVAVGLDGSVYIGGDFTNLTDANGDYISKWNGSAWVSLGSGMNGRVNAIAIGPDGSVYAGGAFTLAGGVANTAYIAKWNGAIWLPLGSGANGEVFTLAFGPDGNLYAGGAFTSIGGRTIGGIAKWNGSVWSTVGTANNNVYDIAISGDQMVVGGIFTSAGGVSLTEKLATYFNGVWLPMDIDTNDGSSIIYSVAFANAGVIYVGGSWTGSTATAADITTITNDGDITYPAFKITGPGNLLQIKNHSLNKTIYFNGLTLLAGETAVLDLNPENISFKSSMRGNIYNTILSGSNLDLFLQHGSNDISVLMVGTTAASEVIGYWRQMHWGLDGQ